LKLLIKYRDYTNVFSEVEVEKLPELIRVVYSIEIEEGEEVLFNFIYILSAKELRVLREYLKNSIVKE
jgi:hypothetical protein